MTTQEQTVLEIAEEPPLTRASGKPTEYVDVTKIPAIIAIDSSLIETRSDIDAVLTSGQTLLMKQAEGIALISDHAKRKEAVEKLYKRFKSDKEKGILATEVAELIDSKRTTLQPTIGKVLQGLKRHAESDTAPAIRETPSAGIDVTSIMEQIKREKSAVFEQLKPVEQPSGVMTLVRSAIAKLGFRRN